MHITHAYNTDDKLLRSNYHYLCEELLRIVNNSTSEHANDNCRHYIFWEKNIELIITEKNSDKELTFYSQQGEYNCIF